MQSLLQLFKSSVAEQKGQSQKENKCVAVLQQNFVTKTDAGLDLAPGPFIANPWQENRYSLLLFAFLQKTFHIQPQNYKNKQFQTIRVTPILQL